MVLAVLMSLTCVWLYDVGESWGQKGIHQVVLNSAEAIAYRYLRTKHAYTKGHVTLNVKAVEGRKLIRPMLIMERPDHGEPITISAEEAELRTLGRHRELSLVMRNGTAYIGDKVSMAFPEAMEQIIPLGESGRRPAEMAPRILHLGRPAQRHRPAGRGPGSLGAKSTRHDHAVAAPQPPTPGTPPATHAELLDTEREHMHWLKAQVNRRWTNGFFCLAFVMIGIPGLDAGPQPGLPDQLLCLLLAGRAAESSAAQLLHQAGRVGPGPAATPLGGQRGADRLRASGC